MCRGCRLPCSSQKGHKESMRYTGQTCRRACLRADCIKDLEPPLLLKFMTNQHLVDKVKGDYRRLPLGTELLENLVNNPVTKQEIDAARKDFYSTADM